MQPLPKYLKLAIESLYTPAGLKLTSALIIEKESQDYNACCLEINNKKIIYREAKTTPTKVGQFVTIWKRPKPTAAIIPFDASDDIDFIIVSVNNDSCNYIGQFIFDREILIKKGLISCKKKRGKLAFRVYGPWVETKIPSAIQAQKWQLDYFFKIYPKPDSIDRIKSLFSN